VDAGHGRLEGTGDVVVDPAPAGTHLDAAVPVALRTERDPELTLRPERHPAEVGRLHGGGPGFSGGDARPVNARDLTDPLGA
jgi:hypothetical protein